MRNIVYFDLETQKSAEEVGGWHNISAMRMSLGVTYSTAKAEYKIFGEQQVGDLLKELQRADLVVGYNHVRFDYEVLHGYTTMDMNQLPSLDIMVEIQKLANRRPKLDDVAESTLGINKTAEGLQALEWFKQGRLMDIAEYCCYDVKITKLVYEYGVQWKEIFFTQNGRKVNLPVKWEL